MIRHWQLTELWWLWKTSAIAYPSSLRSIRVFMSCRRQPIVLPTRSRLPGLSACMEVSNHVDHLSPRAVTGNFPTRQGSGNTLLVAQTLVKFVGRYFSGSVPTEGINAIMKLAAKSSTGCSSGVIAGRCLTAPRAAKPEAASAFLTPPSPAFACGVKQTIQDVTELDQLQHAQSREPTR